jgi:hypothetical protein
LNIVIWNLPFDYAQGGESFDFAQDREPVERHVEPFGIWCLEFGIYKFDPPRSFFSGIANYL